MGTRSVITALLRVRGLQGPDNKQSAGLGSTFAWSLNMQLGWMRSEVGTPPYWVLGLG